jgi:hypothetical protein
VTRTLEALYEDGVLKPLEPGIEEPSQLDNNSHPLAACVGFLPDEDADEICSASSTGNSSGSIRRSGVDRIALDSI